MGVKVQSYKSCEGGSGSDEVCQKEYSDPAACCFSMTLKNFPADPTADEVKMIKIAAASGAPVMEKSTKYLCMSSKLLKELAPSINANDEI